MDCYSKRIHILGGLKFSIDMYLSVNLLKTSFSSISTFMIFIFFFLFLVPHHSRVLSSILTLTLSFVFIFIEIYYCYKDHLSGPKKCPLLLFGALHFNHLSFRDPRPPSVLLECNGRNNSETIYV